MEKSFDFSIRIVELVKYLNEEKRPFLLEQRLLSCGTGIGVCLRLVQTDGCSSHVIQAMSLAAEAEYLLEVMAARNEVHALFRRLSTRPCAAI